MYNNRDLKNAKNSINSHIRMKSEESRKNEDKLKKLKINIDSKKFENTSQILNSPNTFKFLSPKDSNSEFQFLTSNSFAKQEGFLKQQSISKFEIYSG